jgi:hypothetical protein
VAAARDPAPAQRARDPLQLITSIGSPIALGTALLLYFGWVRSEAQAEAFGADASIFGMSPQELVLRSINVLFFPIVLLLLGGLLVLRFDPLLRARGRWVGSLLRLSWVLIPIGLVVRAVTPTVGDVVIPLWWLLAIAGTAYGNLLRRWASGDHTRTRGSVVALVGALVTVTLFWQTQRLAELGGRAVAEDLKADVAHRLSPVSVFTEGKLHVEAPGVTETALPGPDTAYHYRYEGLWFLQRSGGKYFLVTEGWSDDRGRLVVLPDNDTLRVEFGR